MKNILIDCRYINKYPRGIGVFIEGLLGGLKDNLSKDHNIKISLLVPFTYKETIKNKYGNKFNYIFTLKFSDPVFDFFIFQVLQLLFRFDLIHLTGNTGPIFFFNKPKLITTIHDVSFMKFFKFNKGKSFRQKIGMYYRKLMVPKIAKYSDLVITVSNFASKDIRFEIGLKYDPYVIRHGLDFYENKNSISKSAYFIVISGQDPQKNLLVVIEAFNIINLKHKLPIKLKIIGISIEQFLRDNNGINLFPEVEFCGKLSHLETIKNIAEACCTIVPSHYESFGLPVLESLMLKTPVICSSTGALREVAGEAGLYFDPNNSKSLVDAIINFHNLKPSNKVLNQWIEDNKFLYSWNFAAKEYIDKYKNYL